MRPLEYQQQNMTRFDLAILFAVAVRLSTKLHSPPVSLLLIIMQTALSGGKYYQMAWILIYIIDFPGARTMSFGHNNNIDVSVYPGSNTPACFITIDTWAYKIML
jgi:hypothetical protein